MDNEKDKEFLSPDDLIEMLPLGRDKVYELIRSPGFPAVKIRRSYIIWRPSLEKWIKEYEGNEFIP